MRDIRRAGAAIQHIIAGIAAQIVVGITANQGIAKGTAIDAFDAGEGVGAALTILRLARGQIDAHGGASEGIISYVRGAARAIDRIIAAIAAEGVVIVITDQDIITRTTARLFNTDQRIGAAHAIIRSTGRQIHTDRLRRGIGAIVDHIARAAAPIDTIAASVAPEPIIASTTQQGIGKICSTHSRNAY